MRYGFDLDGTLTDFGKFVLENAPKYMKSKYNMDIINLNGYDVDQVFDIEQELIKKGFSKEQAALETDKILSEFWEKFYAKYSLMTPFRNGVKKTINRLYEEGNEIFIFTSRKKTCNKGLLGEVMRKTTKLQFALNKVKYTEIIFLPDDDEKIDVLKKYNIVVMVDDKPELMAPINEFTDVICVNCDYNINHDIPDSVYRVDGYENDEVYNTITKIVEEKKKESFEPTGMAMEQNLEMKRDIFFHSEVLPSEVFVKTKI